MRPVPPRRFLVTGAVTAGLVVVAAPLSLAAVPDPVRVQVTAAQGTPVPGKYIVTLKDGTSAATAADQVNAGSVQRFGGALNGFAAKLSTAQLDKLRRNRNVVAIEQDQIYRASTTQKSPAWGLDRIDQRKLPLSKSYYYKNTGSGVNAYVIDTGIAWSHPQFEGRAKSVWKAPAFSDGWDCNGHGTHVAGTIGSKTYGVAKKVNLRSLRVLDCEGFGELSDVIAAVDWTRKNAVKPAVANLSLGGPKSTALNTAMTNLSKSGVFVAVAAGNENQNACNTSPASAGWVQAVGATTIYDNRATFSNYGSCVDIFAPGYGIKSTWPGGGTASLSGTSMASPHVAGAAALYLQSHRGATFPTVQKWLNDNSTKSRLKRIPSGTPNRLLYKGTA
ncbi:S8 family peptidase [Actinomadura miaoliensis]|uniref:S8 family peptidase n=1 Tax=Actinomadura miaoliensis TaxID=430685 RepID=A0ABP7VES7_9ACTN|nr:peptidase S8/S53 subtilisin kexin sedolisin [Actinomadura sp.]